jgi:hypothetical protein
MRYIFVFSLSGLWKKLLFVVEWKKIDRKNNGNDKY